MSRPIPCRLAYSLLMILAAMVVMEPPRPLSQPHSKQRQNQHQSSSSSSNNNNNKPHPSNNRRQPLSLNQ